MFESCQKKQKDVKDLFKSCQNEEEKYAKIIDLGRHLPPIDPAYKLPENIVQGCQSTMFLHTSTQEGAIFFNAESDALISSGLAALLIMVYSGEQPETILKCPPSYLEEIGITNNLTPNRANGLYSMHLRMKQEALKILVKNTKK